ncbi:LruC domain-containing protein [uncultured Microscilla sp.]|uniref:LruC domain-containing protein n=1 Tax=uncultured Microscilla sp. TaxID=432653 RepID=UPI00260CF956|nr:LruC domain-containing protein [uncultured Microscilla sp.]
MKNFNLHIIYKLQLAVCVLGLLALNACHMLLDKDIQPDATGDIQKMIFPKDFNYQSTQQVSIFIQALAFGKSLPKVPLKLYTQAPHNGGQLIVSGYTNTQGVFERKMSLPRYVEQLYLIVDHIGFVREHVLTVSNQAINYQVSIKPASNTKRQTIGKPQERTSDTYTFLGAYDSQGVPDYLTTNDVFDALFLTDVNHTLPENAPVPNAHPEYLKVGNVTDIAVKEEADIWITFVHEGAGWRNSLGYYTYDLNNPPRTVEEIKQLKIIFPNVSFSGSGGGLQSGNKVFLGKFPAGTGIGWFLVAQGWKSTSQTVTNSSYTIYSNPDFNPESSASDRQHNVLINDSERKLVLLGFEDTRRDYPSCDQDFNDAIFYVTANPYTAIQSDQMPQVTHSGTDTDNDGVTDVNDAFPEDSQKAFNNYLPANNTFGTLAFEDLWPAKGDFDFNDLVVNYQYNLVANAQDQVTEINAQFIIRAIGASYHNGFAIQLPIAPQQVASVTGSQLTENYITLANNGVEANQDKAVVVVFDNAYKQVTRPSGFFVNTQKNAPIVQHDTLHIKIVLSSPIDFATLSNAPYNPFIMVNKTRGHEVHLVDHPPTNLADLSLLGTLQDKSNPTANRFYRTSQNLPFALHIPTHFAYPIEKKAINIAFLKFVEWAQSQGGSFDDWYLDKTGYRNNENIY